MMTEPECEPAELRQPRRRSEADARFGMALSPREMDVLDRLSHGHSYADVARVLHISLDTVKSHSKHIFVKLGAKNGAHAVGLGFRAGVLPVGDVCV